MAIWLAGLVAMPPRVQAAVWVLELSRVWWLRVAELSTCMVRATATCWVLPAHQACADQRHAGLSRACERSPCRSTLLCQEHLEVSAWYRQSRVGKQHSQVMLAMHGKR